MSRISRCQEGAAVTEPSSGQTDNDNDPFAIDLSAPHPARVQNALAGGDDNFSADRKVVDRMGEVLPGGVDTARASVRSLSGFAIRAVQYLAAEAGIRQFLNVGVTIPTTRNEHEIAQQAASNTRFVYVGNDPLVLAHAHSFGKRSNEGTITAYVCGSVRDPQAILRQAQATLDFELPVAIVMLTTLNFVPDGNDPRGKVAAFLKAVPSGSYFVLAHSSGDFEAKGMAEATAQLKEAFSNHWVIRPRAEIASFFDGLDMVSPGLVQIDMWRPFAAYDPDAVDRPPPIYAGVARKQ